MWSVKRDNPSRFRTVRLSDGATSHRLDIALLEEIAVQVVLFGISIFGVENFIAYVATGEWSLGGVAIGSFLIMIVTSTFYLIKKFYDFVKDICEGRR